VTFFLKYKGFDYVAFFNGAYEDDNSLHSLAQTGANSIEATLDYGIDANTSQVVADPNYTDSLTALGDTIAQAESLGLSVMVRPLIDFLNPAETGSYSVGEWRQDYQPSNVATFFASYQQMIVAEAEVAQANGAQMLSIGAELDQLTGPQYLSYWTSIINAVRAVFSGALTYSASWNTASDVSFWSQLDYEGIDCYIPLTNVQNPTLQDLINGWTQPATQSSNPGAYAYIGDQSPIQYFEGLSAQSGKPLIFTELGYANDSDAAANPPAEGNSPDPALQADLYQAFFQAWAAAGNASLVGTYFWEWDPNGSSSNVGPTVDSFSPQNDPATGAATAGFGEVITLAPASNAADPQLQSGVLADNGTPLEIIIQTDSAGDGWLELDLANTYSGGTVIDGGTVEIDNVSALGTGGLSLLGGTLDMNGMSYAFPTLYGTATIVASTTTAQLVAGEPLEVATLTVASGYFSGVLADGPGATGSASYRIDLALDISGPGTFVLAGSNGYSGGTILQGGILELGSGGSIAGNVQFTGDGATLKLDDGTQQLGGIIAGAAPGDDIDAVFVPYAAGIDAAWLPSGSSGTLSLVEHGSTLASLTLVGLYAAADFAPTSDGQTGTLIEVVGDLGVVQSGGSVIGATVSGREVDVYGAVTSTLVESGGTSAGLLVVEAGGSASATAVNAGGVETIFGVDFGATISSGGTTHVEAGGTAVDAQVDSDGGLAILFGGFADPISISSGGSEFVAAGGSDAGARISGGVQLDAGRTSGAMVFSGGSQVVESGGTATSTTVFTGGSEIVRDGGVADGITFGGPSAELTLESPSGLSGTIADWQIGNIIDFENTSVASATISGSTLSVMVAGGQTFTYQLAEQQGNTEASLQSDGSGGADVGLAAIPPTVSVTIGDSDVNVADPTASVTFTFSQAPIDFDLADVTATGGTVSDLGGAGTNYSATFSGNADTNISNASVTVTSGGYHDGNGTAGLGGSTGAFVVDTVTPTVAVATGNNDVNVADDTAAITFSFSTAPANFALSDTTTVGGSLSDLQQVDATDYTATFTAAADTDIENAAASVAAGSWQDTNGNAGLGGSTGSFVVDTVTPTVAAATGNNDVNVADDTATITFSFSAALASFALSDTTAVGGSLSDLQQVDATDYTATFTGAADTDIENAAASVADGSWQDANGNAGLGGSTGSFVVDTVTPTVTVATGNSDVNVADDTAIITFSFSAAPANFVLSDTTAVGGSLSDLQQVDATDYTATFTAAAGIDIENAAASVVAGSWQDANGNAGLGGSTGAFVVDTVTPTVMVAPADFYGAGNSDLLFANTGGSYAIWQTDGTSVTGAGNIGTPGSGWSEIGTGDFNGDGRADILFQSSGAYAAWEMNGAAIAQVATFGNPGVGWNFVGIGDFNGDGSADILFQDAGDYAIWETNGIAVTGGGNIGSPGAGWSEVGVGDFNTGNTSDILFENSGRYALWDMCGTAIANVVTLGSPGAGWTFEGIGDFYGNGGSDILFENTGGIYAIWQTNGTAVVGSSNLGSPGSGWSFAAIGDYNGDGNSDILFQSTSGATSYAAWEMNGASLVNVATFGSPGPGWTLQPTA
jgi:autotransporter passenger strand-loop-strand repeat protein/autotransporter-associated beta strand protein